MSQHLPYESWSWHLLAVWRWASYLPSLSLTSFVYEVRSHNDKLFVLLWAENEMFLRCLHCQH